MNMTNPLDKILNMSEEEHREMILKKREEDIRFNTDLRLRAKSEKEVTLIYPLTVDSVEFSCRPTSFSVRSEFRIGGTSPQYSGGTNAHCELSVSSAQDIGKLEVITFLGWPHLRKGDQIRAHIYAGEYISEKFVFENEEDDLDITKHAARLFSPYSEKLPAHLVLRELQKKEPAYLIELLSEGDVVARYRNPTGKG